MVDRVGGSPDPDQYRAYEWLRGAAWREQHFIRRFMKLDDPADPSRLPRLAAEIKALAERRDQAVLKAKKKKQRLRQLDYHAGLIARGSDPLYNWVKVAEAAGALVGEGVPPSAPELREPLLPIIGDLPDLGELPDGFARILREVDRFLATRPASAEPTRDAEPSPEVREAAELLAGRCVVLIGGEPRPGAHEALKAAFRLDDLVWVGTRIHQSIEGFESIVARPEVALVLLAIRWSSHSFGDVKRFCDRNQKPLVRLPAGYHPNQVATQILSQCSEQLRAANAC